MEGQTLEFIKTLKDVYEKELLALQQQCEVKRDLVRRLDDEIRRFTTEPNLPKIDG